MIHIKQALQIVKFEFKYSAPFMVLQVMLIAFLLYVFIPLIPQYFSDSYLGLDILFLAVLTSFSQFFIPKPYKAQSLQNGRWASHFIIILNQLAISKKTIVIYRFISYYAITLMFTGVFLSGLYLSSPYLQQQVPFSTYSVFIIFWLSISVAIGSIQPATETGYNVYFSIAITFLVIGPLFFLIMLLLFYIIYPNGVVQWSLMVSAKWPLQTGLMSIIIAILSCRFWMKIMKKRMTKQDYFS